MSVQAQSSQENFVADQRSKLKVHREHQEMLPVWFFIGVLLLFYGIVILIVGIMEIHHPPPVVLAEYHASFWGGVLLIVIGGIFTLRFSPSR
jgi:uncharacterized membrane protein